MSGRQELLDKVSAAVLQDRNKSYGDPESNFKNIAEVWNWWFEGQKDRLTEEGFTPLDVAHMMTLMKMARLKTNPTHFDSQVDAAGYQACAADFGAMNVPTLHAGELMLRLADGAQIVLREAHAQDMLAMIEGRNPTNHTAFQYMGTSIRSYRTHGSEWQQL